MRLVPVRFRMVSNGVLQPTPHAEPDAAITTELHADQLRGVGGRAQVG